jgi:PAS domain S-box-containing protein
MAVEDSQTRLSVELRAGQTVEPADERYRALVRALPAIIVITNADGEIEDISESYTEYTGHTLDVARNQRLDAVFHPDDRARAVAGWNDALTSGQAVQSEVRLRRHDDAYRWHLVQSVPLGSTRGSEARLMTVSIDIDDRRRAEEQARYLADVTAALVSPVESTELLTNIARLAVPALADICAIGEFDGTARTVRVETAGVEEAERPHVERIHLRSWRVAPGSKRTFNDAIMAGEPVFVPEFAPAFIDSCAPDEDQRRAAYATRGVSLICVPIVARGEPTGMATFATTERSGRRYTARDLDLLREVASRLSIAIENQRLIAALRDANAAKDEFLGLVSHELKTPLTTILGNAAVLQRDSGLIDREVIAAALADIQAEAERLRRIIENLLLLARLEQGQGPEKEPLFVVHVVKQVIARHHSRYPRRRIELRERNLARPVSFTEGYLEQVIENLLSNAEKYSPPHEPIVIEVEREEKEVRIRVLDRGPGIRADDAEHLFQPFYRAGATRDRAAGLGIGLAVCKRLIEAQGGVIWARPRNDGGSEFGFALPTVEGDAFGELA